MKRGLLKRKSVFCGLAVGLLLCLDWQSAQTQQGRLTLGQVFTGLLSQSSDPRINTVDKRNRKIAADVRKYGVTFPLTPEILSELRLSGAGDELINAIREVAPTPKPTPAPPPPLTPKPTPDSDGAARPQASDFTQALSGLPSNAKQLEMVAIRPGSGNMPKSFMMGSTDAQIAEAKKYCSGCNFDDEKPQHQVTIAKPFYIGKYEVTQAQWQAVMDNNPSYFKNCPDCPVENVSWDDAKEPQYSVKEFIKKLNSLQNKYVYRLPSEAEWEYNARAGTKTAFAFGDSLSSSEANFNGKYPYGGAAEGEYREKTIPVGSFEKNDFGLYDMHGNVWEWCEDIYADNYSGLPTDGSPNVSVGDSTLRLLRGGSWYGLGSFLRSANRFWGGPSARNDYYGVRVAASAR